MLAKLLKTEDDRALMIARMVLGFVFFVRGAQGLLGWFGGLAWNDPRGSVLHLIGLPVPLVLLAVVTDFFGGAALMAGLFTRIGALCVAADTVVTFILWGIGLGLYTDWLIVQGGEGIENYLLALALASILVVKGAGAFSFDRLLYCRRPRRNAPRAKDSLVAQEGAGPNGQPSRNHRPLHVLPRALPAEDIGGKQKVR